MRNTNCSQFANFIKNEKTFTWLYTTVLATSLLRKGFCISSWRLHSFKNVSVYRHLVWTYKDREVVIICLLHGCSSDATSSSTLTALECTHFVCLFMEATDGKYNPHLHVLPSIMSLTLGQNLSYMASAFMDATNRYDLEFGGWVLVFAPTTCICVPRVSQESLVLCLTWQWVLDLGCIFVEIQTSSCCGIPHSSEGRHTSQFGEIIGTA